MHKVLENNFNYNIDFKINNIFTEEEKQKCIDILKTFENSDIGKKYKKIIPVSVLEENFAFDKKLQICKYNSKECWFRGSADLYYVENDKAIISDWKSGKDKSDDKDFGITQSMMYAVYIFLKYPDVKTVNTKFVFLEHSTQKTIIYTRDKFNEYIKYFVSLTNDIETEKFFEPNVTALCDWCDFQAHGHCSAKKDYEKRVQDIQDKRCSFNFLD